MDLTNIPLGRMGESQEIARLAVFLGFNLAVRRILPPREEIRHVL
jgi:hypothetical protein